MLGVAGLWQVLYVFGVKPKGKVMTTGQFAKAVGLPWSTVVHWAQTGIIPGIEREETLRGPVWVIPESAVATIEKWRPKPGRPRKPLDQLKGPARRKD